MAEILAGKAAVVQINSQDNPGLARRFGVRGVPVLFLFRNGRIVGQIAGAQSVEDVLDWYRQHASP